MAKKAQKTKSCVTVKCQCNTCGQIANAQEGTVHFYCKGIHQDILARMPPKFKGMTNPTKAARSKWLAYVEPVKVEEPQEAAVA